MRPSTSTASSVSSSGTNTPDPSTKCQICYQQAHGKHFGVDSCRACAAFFRRVFVTHKQHFKCRDGLKKCTPDSSGRWTCKRCRTEKCFALGMKPDNIQYNRDHFFCSEEFSNQVSRKTNRIVKSLSPPEHTSFIDVSPLIQSLEMILSDHSRKNFHGKARNHLQKLAYGLKEVRKSQIWDNIPVTECIGKEESLRFWKSEIERACTWLTYFDEFQCLSTEEKLIITKCMWIIFTRLERSAMTADLRRANKCKKNEYAFTTYSVINTDTLKWNFEWLSHFPSDNMRTFLGTTSQILCVALTECMIEVEPTDEELCYILCDLCFYYLGSKLGGSMLKITERLQQLLSDDLHQYYVEQDKTTRYSHRLSKLLKISRQYKQIMEEKRRVRVLGEVFGAFRAKWSSEELFVYERFE
uniref:Nuclear receptor domain-containing protein n=1 Tax=Caenorhabditis tropicalis TaxID=1561998 RepID=A0A1I7UK80_9PELO